VDVRRSHNPKDIGFTAIINSVIEDEMLTADALAVLVYLLSKPDGWVIRQADLKRRFGFGKEKQQAVYRCLENARYLTRERVHGEGGRIGWDHVVYDQPQGRPDFDPYGRRRGNRKTSGADDPFRNV
jgi:hypothetical protein